MLLEIIFYWTGGLTLILLTILISSFLIYAIWELTFKTFFRGKYEEFWNYIKMKNMLSFFMSNREELVEVYNNWDEIKPKLKQLQGDVE